MKKNLFIIGLLAIVITFVSCNNYGTKLEFDDTELYYTDDITEDEAENIGEYLQEEEFTEGEEKTVQIAKNGDTYQFRMVVKEGYDEDEDFELVALDFIYNLSYDVLDGEPVELHMCDEKLETLKVVEMDDDEYFYDENEWDVEEYDGTEIEYDESVSFSEVDNLGSYLIETGFTDGTLKSIIFIFDDHTYKFKMVTGKKYWNDDEYYSIAEEYAQDLSEDVFDGYAVEIHLCDDEFNTKTVVDF